MCEYQISIKTCIFYFTRTTMTHCLYIIHCSYFKYKNGQSTIFLSTEQIIRNLIADLNSLEEALITLQSQLSDYLKYQPTEDERDEWRSEVLNLWDEILSAKDTLAYHYKKIRSAAQNAADARRKI